MGTSNPPGPEIFDSNSDARQPYTTRPIPDQYIAPYVDAGADAVTVHVEATPSPHETLQQIRELGAAAGIAINPPTPLADLDSCLDVCDLILVMSVMPGFGGQEFDPVALDKLGALRAACGDDMVLAVDGGINERTIEACAAAGADWFVAGSAIFGHKDYAGRVGTLAKLARRQ